MSPELEVRERLETWLRRPVDDAVWSYLVERRRHLDVLDEEDELRTLADEVRDLEALRSTPRPISPPRAALPDAHRARLLSWLRVVADEIAARADVEDFRTRFVRRRRGGSLLNRAGVAEWVRNREPSAERASYSAAMRVDAEGRPIEPLEPPQPMCLRFRDHGRPVVVRTARVDEEGTLGRLRRLVARIAVEHGLGEEDAVDVILTGSAPPGAAFLEWSEPDRRRGLATRLPIEVSLHTPPSVLSKAYAEARAELLGREPQAISPKHQSLAVFIGGWRGGTWREAMADWNCREEGISHREPWLYADRHPFSRDAREAYRRLMGRDLVWPRPPEAGSLDFD